ncbi:MAG TPA: FAD-dependent monooxygenase [Solirubrobacterales bacterium]|nr:FAD-dependent monooxygenase [Solirubrobacterales bacterium]
MTSCDVLVVGTGPTGLTLATELRRRDVDVLLVDPPEAAARPEVRAKWIVDCDGCQIPTRFHCHTDRDAANLGWKLALVCEGDADPKLLDSYAAEQGSLDYSGSPIVVEGRAGRRLPDLGSVTAGEGAPKVRLHELTDRPGHTLLAVAIGDGGEGLARLHAQLEALVARSPLFDAVFALATGPEHLPFGSIHPEAAAALGVGSLAVLAVRPDGHVGLVAEPATLADVEAYEALIRGGAGGRGAASPSLQDRA